MTKAVEAINRALTALADCALFPFAGLDPIWGLTAVSVVSGVVFLALYGRFSNQSGLKRTKRRIASCVLEAVIYRHDLGVSLRAQGRMFGQAFVYVWHALPPLAILMLPCLLILAQLNLRYNARGLRTGEPAIVRVQVDQADALAKLELQADGAVKLDSPPLRIPRLKQAQWRVKAGEAGPARLSLRSGAGEAAALPLSVGAAAGQKLPVWSGKSPWWALLYPGGRSLPASSAVSEISIAYPEERYPVAGIRFHWLVLFVIISIAAGLAAAKLLGVEI